MKHIKALQVLIDFEIAIMHRRTDKIKKLLLNTDYTKYFSRDVDQTSELVRLQSVALSCYTDATGDS